MNHTSSKLLVSPQGLLDKLFEFETSGHRFAHSKFFADMMVGVLGAKSTLLSNIARFLHGYGTTSEDLQTIENRLSRMLSNEKIPWESCRERLIELGCRMVRHDDLIAFDPGDITKPYAEKMESLYRVHDGSQGECGNGYEDFSVEAIQWIDGHKYHIPLHHKLTNASREDYISQNAQICNAIYAIREYIGDKGIWLFDRGHDRSVLFKKVFLACPNMRWIVRACEDRNIIPENEHLYIKGNIYYHGLMDVAKQMKLHESPLRLTFPQVTAPIFVGWEKALLLVDGHDLFVTIVVAHDKRNQEPVILITSLPVNNEVDAITIFGYYIERWRKEEGYRFTKSFLNSENIRVMDFNAIDNLAWFTHVVYFWVTLFYKSAPAQIENLADSRLLHFKEVKEVRYKYYRVAQLMRLLLCEQSNQWEAALMMTEVA